ncbi:MAG: NAD(P)H-binding protein [Chloroflexi bacterium]|nr:NAD(P)H-binding protein [Chloroflexota bacterium]
MLITSAASATAQIIAGALVESHKLRLTDISENSGALPDGANGDIVACDLSHEKITDELVAGVDAIVNIGYRGQAGEATHLVDYHTRCMYNLLQAASDAGVPRYVNVSTLRLFEDHEENLVVTEQWRTDPSAEDVELLGAHMAEAVCKEFARDRLIQVANLRLGWPFLADNSGTPDETAAISHDLIGAAVVEALTSNELEQWQDIHVQSPVPNQRFITRTAATLLPGLAERLAQ